MFMANTKTSPRSSSPAVGQYLRDALFPYVWSCLAKCAMIHKCDVTLIFVMPHNQCEASSGDQNPTCFKVEGSDAYRIKWENDDCGTPLIV